MNFDLLVRVVVRQAVDEREAREVPHGGSRPFHQKSTCLAQSTLGGKFGHVTYGFGPPRRSPRPPGS